MLPPSFWGPVDCNFGDGVGILAQHAPSPAPSFPGDDGLHVFLLAQCHEATIGDGTWPKDALDLSEACSLDDVL